MKKFKLELNKETVIKLKAEEVASIQGGGYSRSSTRGGHCKYSRRHPDKDPQWGTTRSCTGG